MSVVAAAFRPCVSSVAAIRDTRIVQVFSAASSQAMDGSTVVCENIPLPTTGLGARVVTDISTAESGVGEYLVSTAGLESKKTQLNQSLIR